MTLNEILKECEKLEIKRKKKIKDDYLELVIFAKDIDKWSALLTDILGPVKKHKKRKPSPDEKKITKNFGGIRPDQTLYQKDFQDFTILAMLWPWKDKELITLKIPMIEKLA